MMFSLVGAWCMTFVAGWLSQVHDVFRYALGACHLTLVHDGCPLLRCGAVLFCCLRRGVRR